MTMRYIGGGSKKIIRIVDFKRNKDGVPAVVKTIEYDPNRSARIALLFYADGEKRYIIAPNGLQVGATLIVLAGFQQQLSDDFQRTVERFLALQTMGTETAKERGQLIQFLKSL